MRIHHSVADGIALARVMLTLTDGGESGAGIAEAASGNGTRLGGLGWVARLAGAAVREGIDTVLHPDHVRTLAHGATVNDVLITAVTAAVARHLRERGDEVDEVHALVPFNLRPLDRPLPREPGNRFGLVLLGLPVGLEDPVARLAEVKRRMDAIKDGHEGRSRTGSSTDRPAEQRLLDAALLGDPVEYGRVDLLVDPRHQGSASGGTSASSSTIRARSPPQKARVPPASSVAYCATRASECASGRTGRPPWWLSCNEPRTRTSPRWRAGWRACRRTHGRPGRARGVDNGRDVARRDVREALLDHRIVLSRRRRARAVRPA